MLGVVGLALLLVIGAAAPAEGNDGYAGEGTALASHQPATGTTSSLQLTRGLNTASSPLWGTSSAGFRPALVAPTAGLAALSERRETGGSLTLPWVSQGKSGLRLPATERLSFAVGYRHLEGEDLWRRYGEAGSVDYDSHDFMLRAHWRF